MKRTVLMLLILGPLSVPIGPLAAQQTEIAQLLLNLEKLRQFRAILDQMKQGYQILTGGYNAVIAVTEGNFRLHKAFLDGLLEVNPYVSGHERVKGIIARQAKLMEECSWAGKVFGNDRNFTREELTLIQEVHGNLAKKSLDDLKELADLVTAGKMRMSDDQRLKAIDRVFGQMEDKLMFLRHFNGQASLLALQRARERKERLNVQKIYGLDD
ncbi:TerB family tellurite resistance protein [Marinilongibacter aquaticus]|uniref:TerB family tellurite resistance protein n=1 Tax=Marinilongibacter aquaticus TaxID=2975157 RepID=UPI0021BD5A91|nr:TerB family tellurite resistance protein [Marinilongibacter aquaticus]UBM58718.1 TerB family tellurite resistance protein [Marinilongibacter aquaticus]